MILVSTIFFTPVLVAAALYPTSPTSKTVFHPGLAHTSVISWIDDGHAPPTNQLGELKIELMLENTIITTLARDIPCTYREIQLHIPPDIGPDSSAYALVFTPSAPFGSIYSARFTISNDTSTSLAAMDDPIPTASSFFSPIISTEIQTYPLIHSTTLSAMKPTSTFIPGREKIGTTASGSHRVRVETSMQFRALYVLWPVFVGAALAS
ncbi:hypothetical protein K439DRAFT_1131532 [Ramaria rubella]|nr:hypothetical protein K439DRAFT_1131532 [Ramaria rubella]